MTKEEKIKEAWGENWKDVIGYENLYQVSNLGRIKSLPKKVSNGNGTFITQEKILKPYLDKFGYHTVNLYLNKNKKLYKIHRLVGIAFIDNPDNKPTINHKNSIRTDNRVENLEWVTFSENNQHAFDFGNKKPMKGDKSWIYGIDSSLHPLAKKVFDMQTGRIYTTLKEATSDLKLKYSTVLSKINLTKKGKNDTSLVYLDDLKEVPQLIQVKVGTTIFDYELKYKLEWIKIESEDDLPKDGHYWVITKEGILTDSPKSNDLFQDNNYWLSNITHYRPIEKPKPPIY